MVTSRPGESSGCRIPSACAGKELPDVTVLRRCAGLYTGETMSKTEVVADSRCSLRRLRAGKRHDVSLDPAARGGRIATYGGFEWKRHFMGSCEKPFHSEQPPATHRGWVRVSPARKTIASARGGQMLADIGSRGLQGRRLVRSPWRSRIRGIHGGALSRCVFTARSDGDQTDPRRVGCPCVKISEQPVLATGKVRQVGELRRMCVAANSGGAKISAAR